MSGVYLYPVVYIIFILLDLVLLATGQIFWGNLADDFLCSSSMSLQFLSLRSLVISFHGLLLARNLFAMDGEGHLHFLRFVHRQV